jgi:uncharacterized protein YecA (UPF0149 family)
MEIQNETVPPVRVRDWRCEQTQDQWNRTSISPLAEKIAVVPIHRDAPRIGRNEQCPCKSGLKFKRCHGAPQ